MFQQDFHSKAHGRDSKEQGKKAYCYNRIDMTFQFIHFRSVTIILSTPLFSGDPIFLNSRNL